MSTFILSSVSWGQFFMFFGIAALIWITWVYRAAILSKGRPPDRDDHRRRVWNVSETSEDAIDTVKEGSLAGQTKPFNVLYDDDNESAEITSPVEVALDEFDRMDKIITQIEEAVIENRHVTDKVSFITSLRPVFTQYQELNRPPFKLAIHNFVARLALKEAGVSLTENDTNDLWEQVASS